MKFYKEVSRVPKSMVTGREEINTTCYSEVMNEFELSRFIFRNNLGELTKYDLEHDDQYVMREYESHYNLNDLSIIERKEFEELWVLAKYKNYENDT